MKQFFTKSKAPTTLFFLSVAGLVFFLASHLLAISTVTVTGYAANHSSVKIFYNPVPGAKDYRVYDVAAPNIVKYAGWSHLAASSQCPGSSCQHHFLVQADGVTPVFPYQVAAGATGGIQALDVPAAQIEWNNVGDGAQHTLIIEAVDALGPVPQGALYTGLQNTPIVNPTPAGVMIGGNKGPTGDGKTTTNGQGPYTNNPQVIARSLPFTVQANQNYKAIPSKPGVTQTFFDTFENAEDATLRLVSRNDTASDNFGNLGLKKYLMNAGTPRAWEIEYRQADNQNSMPFITGDHFMDMIFDGATPNIAAPTHTLYGSMSMTPVPTVDISGGKVLHMTMEVDGHQSFRRWMDFNIAPASDPLQAWDPHGHGINNTNTGIFLEFKDGGCTLDIFTGPTSASDPSPTGTAGGSAHGARLWGGAGSDGGAPIMCGWDEMFVPGIHSKNGLGLDDRSRYDFYLSERHAALFQDGHLVVQSDIPAGSFPFANQPLKAYYSHYIYHSDVDIVELWNFEVNGQKMCYPLNSFWFNNPLSGTDPSKNVCHMSYPPGYGFQYSDERHWDNMGFEVINAADIPANDFSNQGAVVQLPAIQATGTGSGSPLPASPTNLRILQQ